LSRSKYSSRCLAARRTRGEELPKPRESWQPVSSVQHPSPAAERSSPFQQRSQRIRKPSLVALGPSRSRLPKLSSRRTRKEESTSLAPRSSARSSVSASATLRRPRRRTSRMRPLLDYRTLTRTLTTTNRLARSRRRKTRLFPSPPWSRSDEDPSPTLSARGSSSSAKVSLRSWRLV